MHISSGNDYVIYQCNMFRELKKSVVVRRWVTWSLRTTNASSSMFKFNCKLPPDCVCLSETRLAFCAARLVFQSLRISAWKQLLTLSWCNKSTSELLSFFVYLIHIYSLRCLGIGIQPVTENWANLINPFICANNLALVQKSLGVRMHWEPICSRCAWTCVQKAAWQFNWRPFCYNCHF